MSIPSAVIDDLSQRQIEILDVEPIRLSDQSTIRNDAFRVVDQENREFFLKIGRWLSSPDDRCLWHEVQALGRLIQHYPRDINRHFPGLVTASEVDIEPEVSVLGRPQKRHRSLPKKGYLLLTYKDGLNMWRLPGEYDQKLVEEAIHYLEDAGVIHLDITTNLLVRGEKDFFWMDFETMLIDEPSQTSYQQVFKKSISEIAKEVCQKVKIPTPSLPSKSQSRVKNLFLEDYNESPRKGLDFDESPRKGLDFDESPRKGLAKRLDF